MHRLANVRMADGIRIATVRRGVDPRGHTLLAFGGAAGLHVSAVAGNLGCNELPCRSPPRAFPLGAC